MDIQDYLSQQNRIQRQELRKKEETIKALQKENYEVKQSIYEKLVKVRSIGKSNDIYKNMRILDIVEKLIDDLYLDIQEELNLI